MMDFCSDKSNSQDLDLLPNIRKGELQLLMREGHEHCQPHFNVDEQLEVQLRFDLGSLVDAQVLLDTQSPRDSHWDFIRQEQSGLGFQVTSEEHSSLMPRAMKQELKPFANSECWPRSPSCQEDTHLFIDAQDDVSMITDTFEVKGRSVEVTHHNKVTAWLDVNGKEQLEEKVFVDEECTQASCGEARVHSLLSQMGTGEALQFVQKSVAALECEGRAIPRKYNSSPEDKVRDEIFKESGTYLAEQTNEAEESVELVPQTEETKESSLSESEIILAEESAPLVSQIEDFKELTNLETDYRTVNVMDTKQSEREEKLGAESQIARETRGQRELNLSEGVGSLQEPVLSCIIEAGVEAFEIQTSNSSEVKNITQVYVNGQMNRLKSESFQHEDESSEEEHDNNGMFSGEHIAPDSFRCVKYKDDALLLMVRSEAIGVEGLSSIAGCTVPTCVSYDKNSKCIEFGNNKVDSSDTGCELLGEQTYREVNLAEKVRGPIPAKASGLVVPTVNKANLCEEGREIITQHNHTILTCDSGVSDVAHWRSEENIPCSEWYCSGVSANEAKGCVAKGSSGDAFIKAEKSEGTTVCNESNQETSEKVAAVLNTSPSSPLQCSSIDMSEKASISFDAKGLKGPMESTGVHAKMTNIKTSYFELEDKTSINLKVRSSGSYDKEADDILKMCEVSPAQKGVILTEEYPQEKMAGSLQEISQIPSAQNAPDGDLGHLELDLSDAKDQMENASYVVVSVQDNEKVCLSQGTPTMEAAFLERKEVDFKSNEDRKLERISVALVGDTSLRGITLERDTSEITKEVSNIQADQGGSGQESPMCVTYENMKEHCVLEVLAKNDAEDHSTVDAMVSAAQKNDCGDCSIARGEQEHTQAGISVVISCGEVGPWQVPNTLRVGSMIKNDNDGLTKSVAVAKEYAKLGNLVLYEALPQQKIKGQLKENELGCSEFRSLCKDPHNISKGDLTVRRTDDIAEEVTTRLSVNTVSTLTETAAGFLESASPASHEFQAGNITLQDKVRKRKPSDTTRRKDKERNICRQDTGNHKTGSAAASQSSPKVPIQNRDTQPTEENANFRGSKLRNASGSEKKKEASLLQIYDNLQTPPMLKKSDASASSMQRNALTNKERTFSESQQVQLRAQILVYGSLIQGGLPDEALMITVFSDTPEAGRGSGETERSLWEKSWQIAVERIHHKSSVSTPRVLAHSFGVNLYGLPGVPPVRTLEEGSSSASGISGGALGLGAAISTLDARNISVSNETFEDIRFLKGFSPGVRQGIEAGIHKQARKVNQPVLSNSPLLPVTSAAMCSQYSPLHESLVSPQSSGAHTDQHQAPMYPPTPPGQFVLGTTHWISHPPVPGIWKAQPLQAGYNFSVPFTHTQSVMSSGLTHETAASSRKGSMSSKSLVPGSSTVHSLSTPVLGPSSAFTFAVNNTGFAQKNLLASASRSRKRKKTESEPLVMSADKLTDTFPSVEMAPPVASDAAAALNVTGWSSGAHVNGLVTSSPLILPTCTSADSLVIAVAKNQISSEALHANQTSILPLTSLCSAASACPTAECKLLSTVECQERFMISQNLVSHLEQAKTSAEEASSRAAYSVRESESMWSQLQSENSSGLVSDLEMQLVSSSIAITTAASVAKAAAAVATVAYEAAIQAKTIRDEALRVIEGGKDGQGCGGSEDLALRRPLPNEIENNDSFQRWEVPNSFKSIMETAKIASKKRLEAASAAKMRAQNLDSVVKAAELVTAAVSQVGAVVAMGDCVPFNMDILLEAGPEGFHRVASCGLLQDNDKSTQRGSELQIPAQCLGKGTDSGTTEKVLYKKDKDVVKETPMQEVGGANQLTEPFSGDALDLSINNTCQGNLHPDYAGNLICSKAGAKEPAKGTQTEICHKEGVVTMQDPAFAIQIAKNSIIEVLSDKEGALGMWFSARVLNVEGGKALVLYDKLLSVDGCHPLKEWVNLENTAGDTPPRVRLAHPNTIISFEGMRKRRREAMDNMKWSIGDRVDAWIQDGWRDGKIVELLEENESKAKVLFQGDGGTTLIKTSKLRPSLVWSNRQWVLWTQMKQDNLRLLDSSVGLHKGETPIAKRQKIENGQLDISNSMKRNISGESTTEIALSLSLEEKNLCVSANKLPVDGKILEVGSRVASDVTKLTKKRKLLEATKACAPGSAACSSPGGKGIGKHEDHHLRALEFHMQSARAIKDNAQAKQKRAFKQVVRAQEDVQIPQRKNTIQKNEKEIPYLKCRMIMQKSASSHEELASGHKKSEPKGANKKVPTVEGQLNAHRQTRNTSIALAKETTTMQKLQIPDNKYVATPVDLVGNKKQSSHPVEEEEKQPSHREKENGKQPSFPVKEFMKDIGFGMPGAELLEPRRSGRKIQPTSKLLEGLQNTFQIGRNGVAFTCEKGSKSLPKA